MSLGVNTRLDRRASRNENALTMLHERRPWTSNSIEECGFGIEIGPREIGRRSRSLLPGTLAWLRNTISSDIPLHACVEILLLWPFSIWEYLRFERAGWLLDNLFSRTHFTWICGMLTVDNSGTSIIRTSGIWIIYYTNTLNIFVYNSRKTCSIIFNIFSRIIKYLHCFSKYSNA